MSEYVQGSILKELGISPYPWSKPHVLEDDPKGCKCGIIFDDSGGEHTVVVGRYNNGAKFSEQYPEMEQTKANLRIIYIAPALLEALILSTVDQLETAVTINAINLIEKATDRTWKEVKELYYKCVSDPEEG